MWEYLNSNVNFNLHAKFESSIGVLSEYKSYNSSFDQNQSSSILKKYWNNYQQLTEVNWKNSDWETSKAEIDLEITDNTWNKTVYFNFKSILENSNTFDDVDNYMYS